MNYTSQGYGFTHSNYYASNEQPKQLWQRIVGILLFVAVMIVLVLPFLSFYRVDISTDFAVDPDTRAGIRKGKGDEVAISMLELLTDDEYSIAQAYDDFSYQMDFLSTANDIYDDQTIFYYTLDTFFVLITKLVVYGLALAFLIQMIIIAIKAIIGITRNDYAVLVKCAMGAYSKLILTFLCFTVYACLVSQGVLTVIYPADENGFMRFGISMTSLGMTAMLLAFVLILGAIIVGMVMNKGVSMCIAKRAGTVKSLVAFIGLSVLAFAMLTQKAQYLFNGVYGILYQSEMDFEADAMKYVILLGLIMTYTVIVIKTSKEIKSSGIEALYFSNFVFNDEEKLKIKRSGEPNILATVVFFILTVASLFVFENEYEFFPLDHIGVIIMTGITVATYIVYKVFSIKLNPNKYTTYNPITSH